MKPALVIDPKLQTSLKPPGCSSPSSRHTVPPVQLSPSGVEELQQLSLLLHTGGQSSSGLASLRMRLSIFNGSGQSESDRAAPRGQFKQFPYLEVFDYGRLKLCRQGVPVGHRPHQKHTETQREHPSPCFERCCPLLEVPLHQRCSVGETVWHHGLDIRTIKQECSPGAERIAYHPSQILSMGVCHPVVRQYRPQILSRRSADGTIQVSYCLGTWVN